MNEVLELNKKQLDIIKDRYKNYLVGNNNQYIYFTVKLKDATVNAYKSGKVVIQGKDISEIYNNISKLVNAKICICPSPVQNGEIISNSIGSDEVGTGDLFGPIVVCAFYSKKEDYKVLKDLGVRDSKAIKDDQILIIADKLRNNYIYEIVVCSNLKYNEYISKGYNMNKIKALLHNHAITKLITNNKSLTIDDVIMDQFTTPKSYFGYFEGRDNVYKDIKFFTKGESVSINIAAASILARAEFVKIFDKLSDEIGFQLQKGAGSLVDEQLIKLLVEHDEEYLKKICKMNFKNIQKVKASRF